MLEHNSITHIIKAIENAVYESVTAGIDRLYIAFSGGVDSLALLYAAVRLKKQVADFPTIVLLHVNHNLRGSDIAITEKSVVYALTEILECESIIYDIPKGDIARLSQKKGIGTEAAARMLRYAFFEQSISCNSIVLTGHHQDDQLETVIMRMADGVGAKGLKGIPSKRGPYRRPLLDIPKNNLRIYVDAMAEKFGAAGLENSDESNFTDLYRRNRVRNHIIPVIDKVEPGFRRNLKTLIHSFNETADLLDTLIPYNSICIEKNDCVIPLAVFLSLHSLVKKETLYYIFDKMHAGSGKKLRLKNIEAIIANILDKKSCDFGDYRITIDKKAGSDFLFLRPLVVQNAKKGYLNKVGSDGVLNTPVGAFDFSAYDTDTIFVRSIEKNDQILIKGKHVNADAIVKFGLVAVMNWQIIAILTESSVIPADNVSGEVKILNGDLSG